MKDAVSPGRYRHYKGKEYRVSHLAHDSSDGGDPSQLWVVYAGLYDSEEFGPRPQWVRKVEEWLAPVTVDGAQRPRYERIGD